MPDLVNSWLDAGFLPLCKTELKFSTFYHLIMFCGSSLVCWYPKNGCRSTRWNSRWKTKVSHLMFYLNFMWHNSISLAKTQLNIIGLVSLECPNKWSIVRLVPGSDEKRHLQFETEKWAQAKLFRIQYQYQYCTNDWIEFETETNTLDSLISNSKPKPKPWIA